MLRDGGPLRRRRPVHRRGGTLRSTRTATINRKHATVLGCWGYEFSHLHRSLAMMARHNDRFRWRELVTREYPLEKAGEALADMERLAVVKALIRP